MMKLSIHNLKYKEKNVINKIKDNEKYILQIKAGVIFT